MKRSTIPTECSVRVAESSVPNMECSTGRTERSIRQTKYSIPQTKYSIAETERSVGRVSGLVEIADHSVLQPDGRISPTQLSITKVRYSSRLSLVAVSLVDRRSEIDPVV